MHRFSRVAATLGVAGGVSMVATAQPIDPFADSVIGYTPGSNPPSGFTNPQAALGSPTRFTSPDSEFGGAVTPFNQPFSADELVSLGEGGSLTVAFDDAVADDPGNPFGVDLLIFGNSFLTFGSGAPTSEGGVVEVSSDGETFFEIPGVDADGPFPTLGFSDLTEPFPSEPGDEPTDFTKPVDPSFDPTGLSFGEIVAGYDGSGGGVGIDISVTGLSEISFVRITNPIGSGVTPEIDAFSDVAVPAPGAIAVAVAASGFAVRRRRAG